MAESNDATETKAPPEGEKTKRQATGGVLTMLGGVPVNLPGAQIMPGTIATYRKMRANPTIALARVAATAPIRAATWSIKGDDDAQDEWVDGVKAQIEWLWPDLLRNALFSLDYGFQAFEKVWELRDGQYWCRKVKPLLPDITEVLVESKTGAFAGLKQGDVVLLPPKALLITYDAEAGDLHGRSRHENCRKEWSVWNDTLDKTSQYTTKAAGVIPMIEYPEGKSKDATGNEVDNWQQAKKMLAELGKGHGVYMPNTLSKYAAEMVRQGVDISKLKAWLISFLETSAQHGDELVGIMRHLESLMARGWLMPERAILEGQHGTLAESETHASLALTVSNLDLEDIVRQFNWHLVDPLLVLNYGEEARGHVKIVPEKLGTDEQAFYRSILKAVLTQPANVALFQAMLDLDVMLDVAGLPKSKETVDMVQAAQAAASRIAGSHIPGSIRAALLGALESAKPAEVSDAK